MASRIATGILVACCLLLPGALLAQEREDEEAGSQTESPVSERDRLQQRLEELEKAKAAHEQETGSITAEQERLERRIEELEAAKRAQEDATRAIIRNAISTLGSKINEFVTLGGTLEVTSGWTQEFAPDPLHPLRVKDTAAFQLSTFQLDFEVTANDWMLGSFIIEYDDGANVAFPTTGFFNLSVDRINLDTATVTIGNPLRFPPFVTAGRMILPFGISTGDPVADVLTIENPLTVDAFEMRDNGMLLGVAFPTPPLTPPPPPVAPPKVKPLLLRPLVDSISRKLGYEPPPIPPPPPVPVTPMPQPPLFNLGFVLYDGDTYRNIDTGWRPLKQIGATAGFRTKGDCGLPYDRAVLEDEKRWFDVSWKRMFCPWTIDVDIDFNSSVFDSRFLEFEYRSRLDQIGFVPGLATSLKATYGPVALVVEWNGALRYAGFYDDLGRPGRIKPSAAQVSLAYQFDWNPWVEVIGSQGTYLALSFSQSKGLAGAVIGATAERRGFLPRRRFLVGIGEWFLDGARLSIEYSRNWDYTQKNAGTGIIANGFFAMLTYVW